MRIRSSFPVEWLLGINEEAKYLIFARGCGKSMRQLAKAAEEAKRREAEEERKKLIEKYAISREERALQRVIVNQVKKEPTPEEIKRRLKYARNPMEIQQLNRQLAKAYKEQRRKSIDNIAHKKKVV